MTLQSTQKFALAGVAVSLGVAGAGAFPAPAVADPCPAGALCAYVETGLRGRPGTVYGNNTNLLQYPSFDHAQSVFNNGTQCGVTIWNGLNYTGTSVYLPRGTGYGNLATDNPPFYKNIASNRWC